MGFLVEVGLAEAGWIRSGREHLPDGAVPGKRVRIRRAELVRTRAPPAGLVQRNSLAHKGGERLLSGLISLLAQLVTTRGGRGVLLLAPRRRRLGALDRSPQPPVDRALDPHQGLLQRGERRQVGMYRGPFVGLNVRRCGKRRLNSG